MPFCGFLLANVINLNQMRACAAVHRPQGVNEEERSFIVKIIRTKDYADMSRKAANIISAQVIMKPDCVLGLATGGTPVGTYEKLVERYNEGDLDFSEVTSVNLDEYRGLPKEHPESYWSFMHRNLFDKVNIDPAKINLPDGTNPDAEDACAKYNQIIHAVGGIDLQLLGIGHDGHIGFNEPADEFTDEAFKVRLTDSTIAANSKYFTDIAMPHYAITMGIGSIMRARKIILIATGDSKAEAIKATVEGEVTPHCPASILQKHDDVTLFLDEAAASLLTK